jgi:hypothetical protein
MSNIFLSSTVEDVLFRRQICLLRICTGDQLVHNDYMAWGSRNMSEGICKLGIIFSHDKQFYVPCSIFVTF